MRFFWDNVRNRGLCETGGFGAEVLGVTTLEELGLQVDPVSGELKPLELLLLSLMLVGV
jgi:hypothetical protein